MKRQLLRKRLFLLTIGVTALLAYWVTSTTSNTSQAQSARRKAAPNEVILKYKTNLTEDDKETLRRKHRVRAKRRIDRLGVEVMTTEGGTVEETIQQLEANPLVAYAEPNFEAQAFAISDDTSLSQQWGLFKINAANSTGTSAWDFTTGTASAKIAILDSGIDTSHADLAGKVVGSANFTTSPTVSDVYNHGTHVAGIAAAATNNGAGVAGTGYNTVLLNGKVLGDNGSGYYSWIANGIVWAADNGAQVISLSLGGPASSLALADAVNYAWSKGSVIVVAAGNGNTSAPQYPAYYTNAIAVAATDSTDKKASFSNYGGWVDVAAPGVGIYSTQIGNSYTTYSGTSMATPFAAGVAALIIAKGACTTNTCVREHLEKSVDIVPGSGTQWVWGRVNAYKAVTGQLITPTPTPTATPTPMPTATPIPKLMTVSGIDMSYTVLSSSYRRVYTTVTVTNPLSSTLLSSVTVRGTLTFPSGDTESFSGRTNSSGKITFSERTREKGMFTFTVTSITRSSYTYSPTLTSKALLVQ